MLAYVYTGEKRLVLQRVPKPVPHDGTAIIRVLASAICGTDIRTRRFGSSRIRPPRVIGHEVCGVVEEVGAGRGELRAGELVLVVPAVGCGDCYWCRNGHPNVCTQLRTIGFDYDGAFAEYMEIPAQAFAMGNVIRLDPAIPPEAAVLTEPLACCLNGQSSLQIGAEDSVLIFGAGFIGCVHAELAVASGARRVILADVAAQRLAQARELNGRIETVDSSKQDLAAYIREATGAMGVQVIITACPVGETHTTAMELAAARARICLFGGIPQNGRGFLDSNAIHYKELAVFGSHASSAAQNREALRRITAGEIEISKYVSGSFPLDRIEEAFQALKNERVLKLLVKPPEGSRA
jgi:L-iditol 2-dehydrogenase